MVSLSFSSIGTSLAEAFAGLTNSLTNFISPFIIIFFIAFFFLIQIVFIWAYARFIKFLTNVAIPFLMNLAFFSDSVGKLKELTASGIGGTKKDKKEVKQ